MLMLPRRALRQMMESVRPRLVLWMLVLPFPSLPLPAQAKPQFVYRNHAERVSYLQQLVADARRRGLPARLIEVARSRGGRRILAVEAGFDQHAGRPPKDAPGSVRRGWGQRQALLLVAGLEADRPLGCAVLEHILKTVLAGDAQALKARLGKHELYVIPCANPDGQERFFAPAAQRTGQLGNGRKLDWDRDGRFNEDPADDLDGDGQILQMRIREEDGTLMIDPDDPRLLKKADPKKGERGIFTLHPEGQDQDQDGAWNEDGAVGVALNRNFPQGFLEHDLAAGTFAASEPETRGLMDYCLARKNIAMVLVLGARDNLVKPPKKSKKPAAKKAAGSRRSGRFRPRARKLVTKVQADDADIFVDLGQTWRRLTKLDNKDAGQAGGAFHEWAYFQRGLVAPAVNLFQVPEKREAKKDKHKEVEAPAKLDVVAKYIQEQSQSGFVPWKEVTPSPAGDRLVEVGGWKPYVRTTPDEKIGLVIAGRVQKFVDDLLGRFSHVHLAALKVKPLAGGLYEIKATVANDGRLPSTTEQGRVTRAQRPTLVELAVQKKALLQGKRRHLVERLEAQVGAAHFRWVVRGTPGEELELRVAPPRSHSVSRKVVLP